MLSSEMYVYDVYDFVACETLAVMLLKYKDETGKLKIKAQDCKLPMKFR